MYIVNLEQKKEFEVLSKEGAEKVRVKYLIHKSAGAEKFFLRYYSVDKEGHTPLDKHPGEHEVFIMKGRARVKGSEREFQVGPGDAIFIGSNELHQFVNIGNEPLEFLCVRGADELYVAQRSGPSQQTRAESVS
jgi:quercetin dioxygenase-like cupin family protein